MMFLKRTCLFEGSANSGLEMRFDTQKLRTLGLLWCDGKSSFFQNEDQNKAIEFYDNCQDNAQSSISAHDDDLQVNFYYLLDFSTQIVFEQELLYGVGKNRQPAYTAEFIAETKEENY